MLNLKKAILGFGFLSITYANATCHFKIEDTSCRGIDKITCYTDIPRNIRLNEGHNLGVFIGTHALVTCMKNSYVRVAQVDFISKKLIKYEYLSPIIISKNKSTENEKKDSKASLIPDVNKPNSAFSKSVHTSSIDINGSSQRIFESSDRYYIEDLSDDFKTFGSEKIFTNRTK